MRGIYPTITSRPANTRERCVAPPNEFVKITEKTHELSRHQSGERSGTFEHTPRDQNGKRWLPLSSEKDEHNYGECSTAKLSRVPEGGVTSRSHCHQVGDRERHAPDADR